MAKELRYEGEFLSRNGVIWNVQIWQEAEEPFASVGELTFEADEPLVIEWKHTDKEEVVCGSTATLRIESPGDRTYEDLYTIEVGRIRMDVYRNGSLYWSGTLDPEFYEEPYERARYYTVSLTFSDFGILKRKQYALTGIQTIENIINHCISQSLITTDEIDTDSYTSSYFAGGSNRASLSQISIRSENFTDEDGEQSTLYEVMEGVLQPLALRIVQKAGKVYIYDLNGLHGSGTRKAVVWDGASQTMGVDKVLNNIKVDFSPYSSSQLLTGELEYGGEYSTDMTNLTSINPQQITTGGYYSYYPDYSDEHRRGSRWDYNLINFTIFLSAEGGGLSELNSRARYCHILPMVGGPSECTGVAWCLYTGGHGDLTTGWPVQKLNNAGKPFNNVVMRSNLVHIPGIDVTERAKYYVRLSLDMLLDPRYNPFTEGKDGNEKGNYGAVKKYTSWAFIPVGVTVYDSEGTALCHYVNSPIATSASVGHLGYAKGTWQSGAASFGDAWLEYYDPEDPKGDTGILGWQGNRHCIGRPDREDRRNATYCSDYSIPTIFDSFKQMPDGEYMPYPPQGGYVEVVVYQGANCYAWGEDGTFSETKRWDRDSLYSTIRWHLYKAPVVEVVKNNLVFDSAELEDVEYSGYINKAAKESLNIETVCGTALTTCPTAKGIYCRTSDGQQIQALTRAGVTDHPEKLLIGTLYSQYATRHTTLTGEAVIDSDGLNVYTEANQGSKVFMLSEDVQDVITDTTDAMFVELSADEYEPIEEVE